MDLMGESMATADQSDLEEAIPNGFITQWAFCYSLEYLDF